MSWFSRHVTLTRREIAIDQCYNELEGSTPGTDQYNAIVKNILDLEPTEKPTPSDKLEKNTVFTVLVYAGLTLTVIVTELFGHSITSKAMSVSAFKPRI